MTKRIVLYPYKMSSGGSKVLRNAIRTLNIPCIRVFPDRKYVPKVDDIIINWGNSNEPNWENVRASNNVTMLNSYQSVAVAQGKLSTFLKLIDTDVRIPLFTQDKAIARLWFTEQQVAKVYCRTLLRSSAGKGIIVADNAEELVNAPLYVEGLSLGRREYRVHVMNGFVINAAIKKRKGSVRLEEEDGQEVNEDIRSHDRGWSYSLRNEVDIPQSILNTATDAVKLLGLDMGAVDICTDHVNGTCTGVYVFEVNTAPGLEEGSTACVQYATYLAALASQRR